MFRLLWLPLLFLAQPAEARMVTWHLVHNSGYNYYMPPPECLTGPVPRWRIIWLDQDTMDYLDDQETVPGIHMFAFNETVNGFGVIYVVESLPEPVLADVIAHELAHLRGCEHGEFWDPAAHSP